jgi:hypothetical protein
VVDHEDHDRDGDRRDDEVKGDQATREATTRKLWL